MESGKSYPMKSALHDFRLCITKVDCYTIFTSNGKVVVKNKEKIQIVTVNLRRHHILLLLFPNFVKKII